MTTTGNAASAEDVVRSAMALHRQARLVEARRLYEHALRLDPRHPRALVMLAVIALESGEPALAADLTGRALLVEPGSAAGHLMHGHAMLRLNRDEEAARSYQAAVALSPGIADAHTGLGEASARLARYDEAAESFRKSIGIQPDNAAVHFNLGNALRHLLRYEEALQCYDAAIAIRDDSAVCRCNRANVLREQGRLDAALESLDRAIEIDPRHADAHLNRGSVLVEQRRLDLAVQSFDQAIAVQPDHAAARFYRSLAYLQRGDYAAGWRDYEWRLKVDGVPIGRVGREPASPYWSGKESIAGKTLLLHGEQGMGDTLQFCRYAACVADLGAQVILQVQRPLVRLLATLDGVARVLGPEETLPAFDFRCALMSLPSIFGTTLSSVPARMPYIHADPGKTREWNERLGGSAKPRVGLVWSGGFRPDHPETWAVNERRNMPLSQLAALRHADVEFHSLQKGEPAESEFAALAGADWGGPPIANHAPLLGDFSDTAALIENLDLVISVDTSTAHLAGALGKPVWILNRFDACWRWLVDRNDSPWYPGARLYRQPRPGDWQAVLAAVREDLAHFQPSSLVPAPVPEQGVIKVSHK